MSYKAIGFDYFGVVHGNPDSALVLALVKNLKKQGYQTALLSNNTFDLSKHWQETGIDKYFDVSLTSAVIGHDKTDPQAFRHLCDKLKIEPSELIFIDDLEQNLSSAKESGYTPIHFKSYIDLLKKLEGFGIKMQ